MHQSLNYTGLNGTTVMTDKMSKDVEEVIDYVISNFELAEVDIIQEQLLNHLNWYIETTNNQDWEQ
jgi:hypothetical protein